MAEKKNKTGIGHEEVKKMVKAKLTDDDLEDMSEDEAFERAYYQDKRKESNAILISRKSMIGKVLGFAPMVALFVGYLILPLCVIGMTSMSSAFAEMSSMT